MGRPKSPLDKFPCERDSRSTIPALDIDDGVYVYVQDIDGTIYVLPDGSHLHPKVLGNAAPVIYAGDMRIEKGKIADVTNLSGTFQFDDSPGLLAVATRLEAIELRNSTKNKGVTRVKDDPFNQPGTSTAN